MALPKTIQIPLEELDRAQDLRALKQLLRKFFVELRSNHERIVVAIEGKQDK